MGEGLKLSPGGPTRRHLYFLADVIYPNWPILAKPIHNPTSDVESRYTTAQDVTGRKLSGVSVPCKQGLKFYVSSIPAVITQKFVQ